MMTGQDLLVFSDDWGRHPFSCQHLIQRFLPYNNILWVNSIGYRSIRFNQYDLKRAYEKIRNWVTAPTSKGAGDFSGRFSLLNPVCLPFGRVDAVRRLNTWSIITSVRNTLKRRRLSRPIVITTLPTAADFIRAFNERLSVYYCVDDFTQWPGVDGGLMRTMEQDLVRQVDLVVATSEKLQETRRNGRRPTRLLTHGVDVEHFRSVSKREPAAPLKDIRHPVVAYYGLVDERCDLNMLMHLATSMVDVTFLIIGPWRVEPSGFSRLPNVRIIGPVAYDDLPSYLAPVSALILPYVVNDLAQSINPLKMKEYLATGLPVVATALPEVVKLGRYLNVASGTADFQEKLVRALKKPRRPEGLDTYIDKNSWDRKAEDFSSMISEELPQAYSSRHPGKNLQNMR